MLESLRPDLVAHQASPTKDPALRLETMRDAEALRIPWTSGILVGIGETEEDRMAALEALAGFSNLQEVILQNFVPHRRYYGEEPAEIATEAVGALLAHRPARRAGRARAGVVLARHRRRHGAPGARGAAADARGRGPDPAEPGGLVAAAGRRGRDRPGRAERQRRPHLARAPVPVARRRCASGWPQDGYALTERLCVYPQYIDPEWMAQGVLDVVKARFWSFIPRRGSGRLDGPKGALRPDTIARGARRAAARRRTSSRRCSPRRGPR